ncbi:mas-related G-protein coupled receptor member X2-like [Hydractinia symbiolongicarpus]|uniref:mas-related G-protein coupled receptor member X2-like n=1 Tax=Hydractinia symbiolongicarpus TaxID=13093 RepID=UPI00254A3F84|nr:mas-related G-protein coupled receptor member X2-like [Hydractinia symbiolongicarpus]
MAGNFTENVTLENGGVMVLNEIAQINLITATSASLIGSLFIIGINILFICAVAKTNTGKSLLSDLYVMLSMSDLIFGLVSLPMYVTLMTGYINKISSPNILWAQMFISYLFGITSMTAIGAITLELYLAVTKPLTYVARKQKNTLGNLLLVCWLVNITFATVSYLVDRSFYHESYKLTAIAYGCSVVIFMGICQLKIHVYLRTGQSRSNLRNKKAANVALMTLLVYLACFLPGGINSYLSLYVFRDSDFRAAFIDPWVYLITMSNSFFDTIVYGFRSKRLNFRAFLKTFQDRRRASSTSNM